jgi:lactate 2-monooxygenase
LVERSVRLRERGFGVRRQTEIYTSGLAGKRPTVPVDPARLERAARRKMSREGFAYVAGGSGSESTVRENRVAFERWRIVPRMLRGVAGRDTSVELFGRRLPHPLLLAPVGVLEVAHREADVAVARAAARLGVPFIFSSQASRTMEECAAVMGGAPRWFQLYWSESDELVESFAARAEACGCEAIVVTLDTTMLGWRPRDLDLGSLPFLRGMGIAQYTIDPVFRQSLAGSAGGAGGRPPVNLSTLRALLGLARRHPGGFLSNLRSGEPLAAVQRFVATYSRTSLRWEDLAFLRERTRLPILLKGILHPEDARLALEHGADGVIVSNHGGRQVDGEIAALDALPGVVGEVGGRAPVLFDSGVRGGADVFKALALGATAVCLGWPYVYGLALAGERGVAEVVENVLAEFDLTMGLAGCRSVAEISRDLVAPATPPRGSPP